MFFSQYGPRGDTKLIKIDHCTSPPPFEPARCQLLAAGRYRWRTRVADSLAQISTLGSILPRFRLARWTGAVRSGGGIYLVQFCYGACWGVMH